MPYAGGPRTGTLQRSPARAPGSGFLLDQLLASGADTLNGIVGAQRAFVSLAVLGFLALIVGVVALVNL